MQSGYDFVDHNDSTDASSGAFLRRHEDIMPAQITPRPLGRLRASYETAASVFFVASRQIE